MLAFDENCGKKPRMLGFWVHERRGCTGDESGPGRKTHDNLFVIPLIARPRPILATGNQDEKMIRLEGLIQGLAGYVKDSKKPAIQLQRFSSCLTRAFAALQRTMECTEVPSSQEAVVAASTPSSTRKSDPQHRRRRSWRQRSVPPDFTRTNRSLTPTTTPQSAWRPSRHRDAHQAREVERGSQPPRPRQRKVRLRPDTIVVKAAGTTMYADILQRLYAEPALQETVGKSVQSIRRRASGAMVLQLLKGVQNASALGMELNGVLGDTATASALSHKTALEIRDLDECATKGEICTALCHQLGTANLDPEVVRSLRNAAELRGHADRRHRPARQARGQGAQAWSPESRMAEEAQGKRPLIIAGDFNAWSTEWGSSETKPRGVILLDALSALDVELLNTGHTPTFTGPQGSSIIDLSFASDSLTPRVAGWRVEPGVFTSSDHRAITFNLSVHRPYRSSAGPRWRWSTRTLDEEAFFERLSDVRIPHATPEHPEYMAAALITAITEACSVSMSSGGGHRHRHRHEPVYWWTDEIAALRRQCLRARRLAQRARGRAVEDARLADFVIAKG
ncbi:unnamed protein product [Trichogramma brassicae]|uniref:Endonuclease/exonuclease/phosphatase domain-containing protein n=1 Tax=Trichogramma brassicae TaxID=86971 RepID=A0A6H5IU18_9HYME|nr:unnamed protein product [Trichogramma brassicae]